MSKFSPCKICGSINICNAKNISNYEICYYCYVVKNKNNNIIENISNDIFKEIINDIEFDFEKRSNTIVVNSPNLQKHTKHQTCIDDVINPKLNSFLNYGKIDTIIIPNIENVNLNAYLNQASRYINDNIEIFIGFYTSINRFKSQDILDNIKYIYNIYAISKILQHSNLKLFISRFWEKEDYILLQINKSFNKSVQDMLQITFDKLFFKNFKKEISI